MKNFPEHPEINRIERTGYPSWMQDAREPEFDEDCAWEERRERERFGSE